MILRLMMNGLSLIKNSNVMKEVTLSTVNHEFGLIHDFKMKCWEKSKMFKSDPSTVDLDPTLIL